MSEYTKEELENLSRVDLRREAMKILGIDNKTATNYKSSELVKMILEGQGGKKAKGKPAPAKGKGKPAPEPDPEETEEETSEETSEETEPTPPPAKGKTAAPAGTSDVIRHLNAIGKALDENHEASQAHLDEIERKLFIISGLMTDLFKATNEPDELDGRLEELQKEWEAQDEDEGNG